MPHARRVTRVLLAAAAAAAAPMASACPMCKVALAAGANTTAEAYQWSIVFMLVMPFVLLGGFGLLVWRWRRQMRRPEAARGPAMAAPASRDPAGIAPS